MCRALCWRALVQSLRLHHQPLQRALITQAIQP
jgi:hypothetical protein